MESGSNTGFSRREALAMIGGGAVAAAVTPSWTLGSLLEASPSTPDTPLHYASLLDVAAQIEARELSPVELTRAMLDRIGAVDGRLHSYVTVLSEHALAAAHDAEREIEAGNYHGPLHGVPIAVKDLCYMKGVPTMGGLAVLADFVPDHDATVVTRLEAAGAVILGKLALTEGAMAGYHRDFEIPINPWNAELWTGVSSSGSGVATAAGLCFASLGTDTGGSIRLPSMANGIVGLKPTFGRVSKYGVLPLAESLDHVGPMTRRVADAAVVLEAIAGHDPNDPTTLRVPVPDMRAGIDRGVAGTRIGYDRTYATDGVDPGLVTAIEAALDEMEALGAEVVDVTVPPFTEELINAWFLITAYEAHAAHSANYPSRADEYGAYFGEVLGVGAGVSDAQYDELTAMRIEYADRFRGVLSEVDAIAAPAGGAPFPTTHEVQYGDLETVRAGLRPILVRFTFPVDIAGTPSITLPCGISDLGPSYTMQFLGSRLSEPELCRIGYAYEQATSWHERHPDV